MNDIAGVVAAIAPNPQSQGGSAPPAKGFSDELTTAKAQSPGPEPPGHQMIPGEKDGTKQPNADPKNLDLSPKDPTKLIAPEVKAAGSLLLGVPTTEPAPTRGGSSVGPKKTRSFKDSSKPIDVALQAPVIAATVVPLISASDTPLPSIPSSSQVVSGPEISVGSVTNVSSQKLGEVPIQTASVMAQDAQPAEASQIGNPTFQSENQAGLTSKNEPAPVDHFVSNQLLNDHPIPENQSSAVQPSKRDSETLTTSAVIPTTTPSIPRTASETLSPISSTSQFVDPSRQEASPTRGLNNKASIPKPNAKTDAQESANTTPLTSAQSVEVNAESVPVPKAVPETGSTTKSESHKDASPTTTLIQDRVVVTSVDTQQSEQGNGHAGQPKQQEAATFTKSPGGNLSSRESIDTSPLTNVAGQPTALQQVANVSSAPAPPPAETSINVAHVNQQIVGHIERMAIARPTNGVVVHLQPQNLGSVTLIVKGIASQMSTQIIASNDRLHAALQTGTADLTKSLADKGVSMGQITVSKGSGTENSPNNPNRQPSSQSSSSYPGSGDRPRQGAYNGQAQTTPSRRNLALSASSSENVASGIKTSSGNSGVDLWI